MSGEYHAAVLENAVCGVNFGRRGAWAKLANDAFVKNGSDAEGLLKTSQDLNRGVKQVYSFNCPLFIFRVHQCAM